MKCEQNTQFSLATETSWWYFRAGTQETYIWIPYPRPRASGIWYLCGKDLCSCCVVIYLWQKAPYQLACETLLALGENSSFGFFACFLLKRDPSIILVIIPDTAVRSYTAAVLRTVEAELSCATGLYSQGKQSASSAIWGAARKAAMESESSWEGPYQLSLHRHRAGSQGMRLWLPQQPLPPSGLGHAWWRQQSCLVSLMSTFPDELQQQSPWSLENPQGVWGLWHTSSLEPQSCCGPRPWAAVVPARNLLWSQAVAEGTHTTHHNSPGSSSTFLPSASKHA